MKKEYIKPEFRPVSLQLENLIAMSFDNEHADEELTRKREYESAPKGIWTNMSKE